MGKSLSNKIVIIDPVGKKAGLDHYDVSLSLGLQSQGLQARIYSNFSSIDSEDVFPFAFNKNIFSIFNSFLLALRKAKKEQAGIVILHVFHSSIFDRAMARLVKYSGFRLCSIIHDAESFVHGNSKITSIASKSDWLIVHNKYTRDIVSEKITEPDRKKLHVIPHGHFLDLNTLIEGKFDYGIDPGKINLLFFGMLKKSKGLELLVEAMAKTHQNIQLIVAGRNRNLDLYPVNMRIKELKLEGRIKIFEKYISNEARNYLFQNTDMIVLPYEKIYQSGVMLMALSYGLPVIASDLPPNQEFPGGTIEMFRTGDANDLAEKINLLAGNRQRREQMSANGKMYVSKEHDWMVIGKLFKNLFS